VLAKARLAKFRGIHEGAFYLGLAEKLSNALNAKIRVLGFRRGKKKKKPDGEWGVEEPSASLACRLMSGTFPTFSASPI
jgi:hypothetical protein